MCLVFFKQEKDHVDVQLLSRVWLFCNPMNYSPPGSSVHGISQTTILDWVAISSPRESSRPRGWILISCNAGRFFFFFFFTMEPPGKPRRRKRGGKMTKDYGKKNRVGWKPGIWKPSITATWRKFKCWKIFANFNQLLKNTDSVI